MAKIEYLKALTDMFKFFESTKYDKWKVDVSNRMDEMCNSIELDLNSKG